MKLKIFFLDIEVGLPQNTTPKQINENLSELKEYWALMMENSWILDHLKTDEYNGG